MYLLYLDDSGSAQNANEEYLVLAGIAVFERRVYWLSQELEAIAKIVKADDPGAVEFHASETFRGKVPPWNGVRRDDRIQIIKDVLGVLVNDHHGTVAFACAVNKASYPNDDPMELAFEDLCKRFDMYLNRKYSQSQEKARGLIILDESAYETTLQDLAKNFRAIGTRWGVVNNMVDVPLFVDSKASRCIQLADHVAYSVFRRYEAQDTKYFDLVASKFDAEGGTIHGLVHKQTRDSNCMCPACLSRR